MAKPTQHAGSDAIAGDEAERRRFDQRGAVLRPHTERLLWDAGIGPGMRVLDVGCGAGDVSVMLADLVGPSGEVVAVDRSAGALAVAAQRIEARGLRQVRFVEGEAGSMAFDDPFDAIVGRFVLTHASDPAGLVRRLTGSLRPNGIVAFQEVVHPAGVLSAPPHPLFERIRDRVAVGMAAVGLPLDAGLRLPAIFVEAGLPTPSHRLDGVVCLDPDPGAMDWAVVAVRAWLPAIERGGVATGDTMPLETLADRLLAEHRDLGGTVCPILLGGAHVHTPPS